MRRHWQHLPHVSLPMSTYAHLPCRPSLAQIMPAFTPTAQPTHVHGPPDCPFTPTMICALPYVSACCLHPSALLAPPFGAVHRMRQDGKESLFSSIRTTVSSTSSTASIAFSSIGAASLSSAAAASPFVSKSLKVRRALQSPTIASLLTLGMSTGCLTRGGSWVRRVWVTSHQPATATRQ